MQNELKPCNCGDTYRFAWETHFLTSKLPLWHGIKCLSCGKKIIRITKKGLIKAWNRRVDNAE